MINITGVDNLRKILADMKMGTLVKTEQVMNILGQRAVNRVKKMTPRGVGKGGGLMGSYRYVVKHMGMSYELTIGTNQEYAPDVEFGTEPHDVNPDDLLLWVRRVLSIEDESEARRAAYLIARKIKEVGTQPQPHLRPGVEQAVQIDLPMIIQQVKNVS